MQISHVNVRAFEASALLFFVVSSPMREDYHLIMLLLCGEYIVPQLEPIDRNESCGTALRNGQSHAEDFLTK